MASILSEAQTKRLIDMPMALQAVEQMFRDRADGKVRSVPRVRLKGSKTQLNMMAAWQEDCDLICLRAYASGTSTISLYSGETGNLRAIMNARYLSSLRTGAASGVASKYLAPAGSEILGLIGPGRQAAFQLAAIVPCCGIKQIMVFGRNPEKRKNFIRTMKKKLSVDFQECKSIDEIEERSDIIVITTNSTTPVIEGGGIKTEALIITMGANQTAKHEVSGELTQKMDLIVTDDLSTAQSGSGDLIAACKAGLIRWEDIVPLERIVAKGRPANRPKRILFQSNGIADEDLAVGRYVLEKAERDMVKGREVTEI
jgi:ornithine cyclodeaminase/alanine dehydrogenase-like protein (mu-crystallin family)